MKKIIIILICLLSIGVHPVLAQPPLPEQRAGNLILPWSFVGPERVVLANQVVQGALCLDYVNMIITAPNEDQINVYIYIDNDHDLALSKLNILWVIHELYWGWPAGERPMTHEIRRHNDCTQLKFIR